MRLKDVIETINAVDTVNVFIDGLGYIYHGYNGDFRNFVYSKWATSDYSSFFDAKVYRISAEDGLTVYARIA